jgi:hypothetical protein
MDFDDAIAFAGNGIDFNDLARQGEGLARHTRASRSTGSGQRVSISGLFEHTARRSEKDAVTARSQEATRFYIGAPVSGLREPDRNVDGDDCRARVRINELFHPAIDGALVKQASPEDNRNPSPLAGVASNYVDHGHPHHRLCCLSAWRFPNNFSPILDHSGCNV